MATSKPSKGTNGPSERHTPPGVWNRGKGRGPTNPIRIRTKRLDEISGDKIALAYWLLAKQIVTDGSDQPLTEQAVRKFAEEHKDTDAHPDPGDGAKA